VTAGSMSLPRRVDPGELVRSALRGPAEGWLTMAAIAAMVVAVAWSIDDAAWIRGQGSLTDSLATFGLVGLALGVAGAKVGWGRWRTHLVGAMLAALILPILAGGIVLGPDAGGLDPAGIALRYRAAADACYQAWFDLAILGRPLTREYAHYIIVLTGLLWATGLYAGYAVFGHRRPLDAVIVCGALLVGNMALTFHEQLHLLVLGSLGALLLLTRSHAYEERTTWLRRRIGDPDAVTALYLRGGTVFITIAILGSLALTATASSAPLQGLWSDLPQRLVELSQTLQKYLPGGGASRNPGAVAFGPNAPITGVWTSDSGEAFRATFGPSETRRPYWLVGTYSTFDFSGWSWGSVTDAQAAAGHTILASTGEDPTLTEGRDRLTARIFPEGYKGRLVVSPEVLETVDKSTTAKLEGAARWFAGADFTDGVPDQYVVTALVPILGDDPGGLTEARLRAAGTSYPADVRAVYLDVPPGTLGKDAQLLFQKVQVLAAEEAARAGNQVATPYDLAKATTEYLKNGPFEYKTNVQGLDCNSLSTVECFARFRQGYCQYYASTMAMLLREAGVPTRLAQGFLPGKRSAAGVETVLNSNAHAWVQVYFPGYGWVDFDPTGGGVARQVPIPSGKPVPPTAQPSPSAGSPAPGGKSLDPNDPGGGGGGGGTVRPTGGGGAGPFIAIGLLLALSLALLAWAAWRRGPRNPMEPETAWRSLSGLARRLGFAPRPSETVFEYAGALGAELPIIRPELEEVARAKVEVAYGHRTLSDERLKGIALAHRRVRLGLLRLLARRFRRRGRRR
jgi:transglutaminase-like putative cysteine protease